MYINIWRRNGREYAADFDTITEAYDDLNDPAAGDSYVETIDVDGRRFFDARSEAEAWRGEQERDASEEVTHRRELWKEHVGIV